MIRVLVAFLLVLAPSLAWGQSATPGNQVVTTPSATTLTYTDCSGTVGSSNTPVTIITPAPLGFKIQNNFNEDLWLNELGSPATAGQPSLVLHAGDYIEFPLRGPILGPVSVYAASSTHTFTCRKW